MLSVNVLYLQPSSCSTCRVPAFCACFQPRRSFVSIFFILQSSRKGSQCVPQSRVRHRDGIGRRAFVCLNRLDIWSICELTHHRESIPLPVDNKYMTCASFCLFISWCGRDLICFDLNVQADPPPSTPTVGKALPRPGGGNRPLDVPLGTEGGGGGVVDGIVRDGVGVDPWVASQVEPFMSSLREALLRDRPADIPGYVSAFSADRQHRRQREKGTVL